MQYLGGKFLISKDIANIISVNRNGRDVLEPFCGSCWITSALGKIDKEAKIFASDFLPDLIMMWQEVQHGWLPPTVITKDEYLFLKRSEPSALRAFAGFACAFAAVFYGTYARNAIEHNYALSGYRSLVKKREFLKNVEFSRKSFDEWKPEGMIIYCDPPYEGTSGYKETPKFNHVHFWSVMREWSKTNTVLVSSYNAPEDFKVVWQKMKPVSAGTVNKNHLRMECLFSLNKIKI